MKHERVPLRSEPFQPQPRLGEMLLAAGHVSEDDIARALDLQASVDAPIGALLVRLGAISEELVYEMLARQLDMPYMAAPGDGVEPAACLALAEQLGTSLAFWSECSAVPVRLDTPANAEIAPGLTVATDDPANPRLHEWGERNHVEILPLVLPPRALARLISDIEVLSAPSAGLAATADLSASHLKELAEQAPIIELVNAIFSNALAQNASDIHIEPFDASFRVRYRVDGMLRDWSSFPKANFDPVVSRVKLLSGMDISERRKPQDGRQSIRLSGRDMDLRVSSLPGPQGESVVLRLLDKAKRLPEFSALGMQSDDEARFMQLLAEPHGIVLVTGPTGSGKSTTLYRALSTLNTGDRKIITIEDPIEYQLEGINQTQVQSEIGFTFASGLRSVLRQDPDIVMVGEIRDAETAQIAVQAALTGHLVLSTVHTNTALGGVIRMADLGVERFLLASALRGLVGQRLVRRLCESCSKPAGDALIAAAEREWAGYFPGQAGADASNWREPTGCADCSFSGYSGRRAVYEIALSDAAMEAAIIRGASEDELADIAARSGFRPMRAQGLAQARRGETSLSEVNRVLNVRGEVEDGA